MPRCSTGALLYQTPIPHNGRQCPGTLDLKCLSLGGVLAHSFTEIKPRASGVCSACPAFCTLLSSRALEILQAKTIGRSFHFKNKMTEKNVAPAPNPWTVKGNLSSVKPSNNRLVCRPQQLTSHTCSTFVQMHSFCPRIKYEIKGCFSARPSMDWTHVAMASRLLCQKVRVQKKLTRCGCLSQM